MPGTTVTVACKLPNGLHLQLYQEAERDEPVLGGGVKTVKFFMKKGDRVTVKGFAYEAGKTPLNAVAGGAGLTPGVDEDFWKAWLAQNKDSPLVRSGAIYASTKEDTVNKMAIEQKDIKSGLEPLDPNNLPKTARGIKTFNPKD